MGFTKLELAMNKLSILLLMLGALTGPLAFAEEEGVVNKAEKGIKKGAEAAARGIEKGVDATVKGVQKGAEATEKGVKKAGEWVDKKVGKEGDK
jgi:hypothetical protein